MVTLMPWLDLHPALWPVFIFCARILDVSIGTLRVICLVRGFRFLAPLLGFFEVTVWVLAISGVLIHLDRWYNIVAYGAGFAAGNALGLLIEQKLAFGLEAVRLISCTHSAAVAAGLRLAGFAVTEVKGHGLSGEVSVSFVVAPRKELPRVMHVARVIDPAVFCTIEDVRSANVQLHRNVQASTGWRTVLKKK